MYASTMEDVKFTNWQEGQPDDDAEYGDTGEDYVMVHPATGLWHDWPYYGYTQVICERDVFTLT